MREACSSSMYTSPQNTSVLKGYDISSTYFGGSQYPCNLKGLEMHVRTQDGFLHAFSMCVCHIFTYLTKTVLKVIRESWIARANMVVIQFTGLESGVNMLIRDSKCPDEHGCKEYPRWLVYMTNSCILFTICIPTYTHAYIRTYVYIIRAHIYIHTYKASSAWHCRHLGCTCDE